MSFYRGKYHHRTNPYAPRHRAVDGTVAAKPAYASGWGDVVLVRLTDGREVIANVGRLVPDQRVRVEVSQQDPTRGEIVAITEADEDPDE
jgi:translation initiation factor IF-1